MNNKDKKRENKELIPQGNIDFAKDSIEIGTAAIGALVGLVIGGPVGAVVGAVASPTVSLAQNIVTKAKERRRMRLENIVSSSINYSGMSIEDALLELSNNESKTDDLLSLLTLAVSSDESLDCVFSGLLAELLQCDSKPQKDRILIIGDAVKNFRSIHLRIISALYLSGGILTASEISNAVNIPEIELRSVVRDLELRGIILDLEKTPVEWKLRELGQVIAVLIQNPKEEL